MHKAGPRKNSNEELMNTQEIVPGTLVHGRYSVRVRIGEGGGGIVYRAFDTSLESWVILKQIKDSTIAPDERRTEVNVLKELRHQRIPKVLDYFNYEGHVYTVMDFIDGRDLGRMLREYHQFDGFQALVLCPKGQASWQMCWPIFIPGRRRLYTVM